MTPELARLFARATICILLISFAAILVGRAQPAPLRSTQPASAAPDEAAWTSFMQWLAQTPPNGDPRALLGAYREELIRRGIPAAEAGPRAAAIASLAFKRPDSVRLLWDKIYAGKNRVFADKPTELLVRAVEGRAAGAALDVGMGQGRNALFLALNGWRVSGFDPSAEGVRQAGANAKALGVTIDTVVATDDQFDFGTGRWDAIVVTYVRDLTRADADRFWTALRPGGIVVYENGASAGNAVLEAFIRYRIVRWEDVVDVPDWGSGERIRIQRLIAARPAQ